MQSLFKQYPAGNDPKSSADLGLNFSILRFNAPQNLNNRAYVGRMDFNLDSAGKHTLMLRGTLAANSHDSSQRRASPSSPGRHLRLSPWIIRAAWLRVTRPLSRLA